MVAPLATLRRLNPDVDAFMARILSPMALAGTWGPHDEPLLSYEQREIDDGQDDMGDASDSDSDSDAVTEGMDTSSDDEVAKKPKPAARPRRTTNAAARPGPVQKRLSVPASAPVIAKSIAVHCDSYVPQSAVNEEPRFIVDYLKTEVTFARGNNNAKNLYDVLHLLSKGRIKSVLTHYKKGRAGRGGVNVGKLWETYWETYMQNDPSLPTCDFYILVRRDPDPLKSVFLKMTLPFSSSVQNKCLLPRELLHELGATFFLVPLSDTTKMTFTDVTTGSPGHGYKFNLPVYNEDAAGPSNPGNRVTFAFMVELSIIKHGTVEEFIPAPLLPNFTIPVPVIESSAAALVDSAPSPESEPAAPPAAAAAAAAAPPPAAPPAAAPALSGASGGVEPSRAEPPTPVNEKDFWSLAPNYASIRNEVFAALRIKRTNVNIDEETCNALDAAYEMLVKSGTRYNNTQLVNAIVTAMHVTLNW